MICANLCRFKNIKFPPKYREWCWRFSCFCSLYIIQNEIECIFWRQSYVCQLSSANTASRSSFVTAVFWTGNWGELDCDVLTLSTVELPSTHSLEEKQLKGILMNILCFLLLCIMRLSVGESKQQKSAISVGSCRYRGGHRRDCQHSLNRSAFDSV